MFDVRSFIPVPTEPDEETKNGKDFKMQKWLQENPTTSFKCVGADN